MIEPALVTLSPPSTAHAFSIPIRTIYSFILQQPTLSSWYGSVTFNLYGGETLPPLYFHDDESTSILDRDRRVQNLGAMGSSSGLSFPPSSSSSARPIPPSWGGEALLSQLRLYAHLIRSQLEPRLFLINPSRADLEVHSTALFEDEVVPSEALAGLRINGSGGRESSHSNSGIIGNLTPEGRERREEKRTSILHQSLSGGDYPDEVGPAMDNFTFSVLNSFSRITRG